MPSIRKINEKQIATRTPYNPHWPARASAIGGKYNGGEEWLFDIRDEERARALMRQIFGTTGDDNPQLVTIRCRITGSHGDQLFAYGRCIASRRGRDERVRLGDGVIIIDGKFPASAGSRSNPALTDINSNILLEIRDVPISLVDDECEIYNGESLPLDPATPTPERPFIHLGDAELQQTIALLQQELKQRGLSNPLAATEDNAN